MAGSSAEEFALWLRPRVALSMLGVDGDGLLKEQIVARILDGRIRTAGHQFSQTSDKPDVDATPLLISSNYLVRPWIIVWDEFWSLGQLSFVRSPMALQRFAVSTIIGVSGLSGQPEVHSFRGVRLDPVSMYREFDLDLPNAGVSPQKAAPPREGGRPGGKHGEPVSHLAIRLSAKSHKQLQTYTADSLSLELIDEYHKLGLAPPSEDNARRLAAGILKAVRN